MKLHSPLLFMALSLAAMPALAHTGLHIGSGFASGVAHPFLGLDHLLAMVMVGLWAAQQQGQWQRMAPPLAFVSCMAAGAYLGESGLPLPHVETGIAVSVLALGLLTAFAVRMPVAVSVAMIGLFAVFHGHAHGAEMPAVALGSYMPGFILSTALLHGLGYAGAAHVAESRSPWVRGFGLLSAFAGGGMLMG